MFGTCTENIMTNTIMYRYKGGYVWNVYGGYVDEHNNVQILVWGGDIFGTCKEEDMLMNTTMHRYTV